MPGLLGAGATLARTHNSHDHGLALFHVSPGLLKQMFAFIDWLNAHPDPATLTRDNDLDMARALSKVRGKVLMSNGKALRFYKNWLRKSRPHRAARDFATAVGRGDWARAIGIYNRHLKSEAAPLPSLRWRHKRPASVWSGRPKTLSFVGDGYILESAQAWQALRAVRTARVRLRSDSYGAILHFQIVPRGELAVPIGVIAFNLLMAPSFAVRLRSCHECDRFFVDQTRNQSGRFCRAACRVHFHNRQRGGSS